MATRGSLTLAQDEEQQEPEGQGDELRAQPVGPHFPRQVCVLCCSCVHQRLSWVLGGWSRVLLKLEFALGRSVSGAGRNEGIKLESRTELSGRSVGRVPIGAGSWV